MLLQSPLQPDLMVLITDTLESPGTFLLTQAVLRALRDSRRTLFLGLANPFEHYSAILRKTGLQLASEREKGRFNFVDGSSSDPDVMKKLYLAVDHFVASSESPMVVLDDISTLLWAGQPVLEVARFAASLRALVSRSRGSLVILQHGDDIAALDSSDDTCLFRRLLQRSDVWLNTTSLASQTRGELSIYQGPALVSGLDVGDRSGATAMQYKLEDAGRRRGSGVQGLGGWQGGAGDKVAGKK